MAEYLQNTLRTLREVHQKGVMDKATSVAKLAKVDVSEKENLLPAKNVEIGFATRKVSTIYKQRRKQWTDKFLSFRVNVLHFCRHGALSYWKDVLCSIQLLDILHA